MKLKILILCFIISFTAINANDLDKYLFSISDNVGFAFLKTLPDAKSVSISGCGTGGYSSPAAYLINPAIIPYNMERRFSFTYLNSFALLNKSLIQVSYPLQIGYLFGGTGFSVSDTMEIRGDTPTEEPLGSYRFTSMTVSAGYGLFVVNGIYWGASVRTISEFSYMLAKTSITFNTGFIATFEKFEGFSFGFSFLNFAPNYRYDIYSSDYIVSPFTVRAGATYSFEINNSIKSVVYTDFIKANDSEYNVACAGECTYNDIITISTGYIFNNDSESFSIGAGFNISKFTVQYSFKPYKHLLGYENALSVMVRF